MNKKLFVFGFGYTAHALVRKLSNLGFYVAGTTRQLAKTLTGDHSFFHPIDFNSPALEEVLAKSQYVLVTIPPENMLGDVVLSHYGHLLQKYASHLKWLGYLSSTGVYGDHQGNWVDEQSICQPHTPSAILRLQAEQAWSHYAEQFNLPLHIFRLAGIYGPGRSPLERICRGKKYSLYKENQVFSRIHVEDIANVLLASMKLIQPGTVYNVADDEPVASHIVDEYATFLLNREPLPLLPFENAHLSLMEQEFYSNNRRVSNLKIKNELKVILKYPTYREGLTQIWRDDFA